MSMSWNYRVCTQQDKSEGRFFLILPVYYKDGIANSWGNQTKIHSTDTLAELKDDFELRQKAFDKPVIDLDNFPDEFKK